MRRRKGQIAGLYNLGQTCFLNTLLQALAACPHFIAWLQLTHNRASNDKGLIHSLLNTLEVINGTHSTLRGDPYSPGAVIRALSAAGWVIPQEEHDAHELFHVMLASLEEDATVRKPFGSLMDALPLKSLDNNGAKQQFPVISNRPSSAISTHVPISEDLDVMRYSRLVRSEAHTPDSPAYAERNSLLEDAATSLTINRIGDDPADFELSLKYPDNSNRKMNSEHYRGINSSREQLFNRLTNSYRSVERLNHGRGCVSVI